MPFDISPYVTNCDGNIFALKNLPEEVVAFLFARYSRSKLSLRDDLQSMLTDEDAASLVTAPAQNLGPQDGLEEIQARARAFADKYVIGYGHSSVAEHAVVHLAAEDVSIVASKLIEDARLSSFTEKSTRYVQFDSSKIVLPPGIAASQNSAAIDGYQSAVGSLMAAYLGWTDTFVDRIKAQTPRRPKQTEKGWDASCRATAFDSLRYLLPAGTKTNVGITINARSLATLIVKLRSTRLPEAHEIADKLFSEGALIAPSLLKAKYTEASSFRLGLLAEHSAELPVKDHSQWPSGVAALPWNPSEETVHQMLAWPNAVGPEVAERLLSGRSTHDSPPRHFERVNVTLALSMDYGAYRDLQRHRIATQMTESFTPINGYEVPRGVAEYGYEDEYHALMAKAAETYSLLYQMGHPDEAQYVLPLAYRIDITLTANLREMFHLIELRSARQGHYSYRLIAQQMHKELERLYPSIAKHIRVDKNDYALTRDEK